MDYEDEIQHVYTLNNTSLYISGVTAAENKVQLDKHHITHILSICKRFTYNTLNDIVYFRITGIDDCNKNIKNAQRFKTYFNDATEFIHKSNTHVLVHCQMGVSRSATICIAYLIKYADMDYTQAYNIVYKARPCIRPATPFIDTLKEWDNECRIKKSI